MAELQVRKRQGTSVAGEFPANGFGLYDMTGNAWERTSDYFVTGPASQAGDG